MAKLPAKKPKLTPEEQLAELAALTGDVAAINLMHPSRPAPVPPAAAPVVSMPSEPAAPVVAPTPTPAATVEPVVSVPAPADRGGEEVAKEKSGSASQSAPEPAPTPAVAELPVAPAPSASVAAPVAEGAAEETPPMKEVTEPAAAPASAAGGDYSLAALFEPSKEKKTVMMRITPSLHQYFQQIGILLGDGASVPDVVHNILLEWKALHGPEVQKALQRQMRQMLKNTL